MKFMMSELSSIANFGIQGQSITLTSISINSSYGSVQLVGISIDEVGDVRT